MACQQATRLVGSPQLGGTEIGRDKAAIGPQLQARTLPTQQGEAAIAVAVLTRMTRTAKPVSVKDRVMAVATGACSPR